jgi:hypothetical protein
MSEKSDEATKAWDEDSKEEHAAQSGEAEVHRVDTVPPPESGDAYSADTVIRDVPAEALEAIRERRKNSESRRAAERAEEKLASDRPTPQKTAVASADESASASSEERPASEKPAAEKPIPEKSATKKTEHAAHPPSHAVLPPVTAGELTIAFAAAIALIVVGFYLIGSAF